MFLFRKISQCLKGCQRPAVIRLRLNTTVGILKVNTTRKLNYVNIEPIKYEWILNMYRFCRFLNDRNTNSVVRPSPANIIGMGGRIWNIAAITTAIWAVTVGSLCMLDPLIVIEADAWQPPMCPLCNGLGHRACWQRRHRRQWHRVLAWHGHGMVPLGALTLPLSTHRNFCCFTSVTRYLGG